MSTIGAIIFLKNTQMSRDNGVVFDFANEYEREEWIETFTNVSVPIKIKDYNGPIVVNVATSLISAATNTNYDYAVATDYTGRTYYYYVTAWKYLTDAVYSCMLTLDTFMTYHALRGTATYLPSLIERQHYDRFNYDLSTPSDNFPIFDKTPEPIPETLKYVSRTALDISNISTDIRKYVDSWYIIYKKVTVGGIDVVKRFLTFKWRTDFDNTNWEVEFSLNDYAVSPLPYESTDSTILLIEKLPALPVFQSYSVDVANKIIHVYHTDWVSGGDGDFIAVRGIYEGIPMTNIDISTYVNAFYPVATSLRYTSASNTYDAAKETKIYNSQFSRARVEYGASSFYINREDYQDDTLPSNIIIKKYLDLSLTFNFRLDQLPGKKQYVYDYVPATSSTMPTFSSDYMNYIRTRDANLAIRNASTAVSIGLSALTLAAGIALSATGAAAPAGAAAIFSSVAALTGQLANAGIVAAQEKQKLKELELQGRAVISQSSGTLSEEVTKINRFNFVTERTNSEDLASLAFIFHVTGYQCGRFEVPNITSRYSFNSLKGDIEWKMPNDKQIPLAHYIDLKERYRNGLMIIHYRHAGVSWAALNSYARVIALCNIEITAI